MSSVLCLGGAGRICREAALDLVQFSDFRRIIIGDCNAQEAQRVVRWLGDPRVEYQYVDVLNGREEAIRLMRGCDVVMDGTTISLNDASTACIAAAGAHGINLNGFGEELKYDGEFRARERLCVPGFGMTPGVTNLMARHAADQMVTVDTVRVSHGAFRPIAFSPSIVETTMYEYDPALPGRVVYENGEFVQVAPFARPRAVALPEPYGTHVQYIIPHAETRTLAEYLAPKDVRLIEVRGTWPPENMQLVRALYDWGFLRNEVVRVDGVEVGVLDAIGAYLMQSLQGRTTRLYGYALHVEVEGVRDGESVRHTLTHSHPPSDGSAPDWEGLRAYTRCVGIPLSIGAQLIARGQACGCGTVSPERAFEPAEVFLELEKRGILIQTRVEPVTG